MSDPISGLPTPAEPSQTTVPQTPAAPDSAVQPPAANNPSPELAQAQAELAAERTRVQNLETHARNLQSQRDQAANQVRALTQQAPQVDPIADKAAAYAKQFGLAPEDTKAVLSMMQAEMQPFMQRQQQQQAALQASNNVSQAMQVASQKFPTHFQDGTLLQHVQRSLQEAAFTNPEYVTPEYAVAVAQQFWAEQQWSGNPAAAKPAAPLPSLNPQLGSLFGPGAGFTPVSQPSQQPVNPLAEAYRAEIAKRYENP